MIKNSTKRTIRSRIFKTGISADLFTVYFFGVNLFFSLFYLFIFLTVDPFKSIEPGCTTNVRGSAEWLQRYLGKFSVFAHLEDLKKINPDFSSVSDLLFYSITRYILFL